MDSNNIHSDQTNIDLENQNSQNFMPVSPEIDISPAERLCRLQKTNKSLLGDLNSKYSMPSSSIRIKITCPSSESAFKPKGYDSWSMAKKYL